jgi:hypothetical protein|tara:strand:- start:144 stop:971 length:828 start_codon:yes stop_codon:yes gene_type:complete
MPLEYIPENLDFKVDFEATRVSDKKYVINRNTGEPIAIVGKDFTCASHGDFFRKVMGEVTENLSSYETDNANIAWRDAHNNGWAMMDMTLPNVKAKITTPKHETEVSQRIIALHGVDGTCSNTVLFGAIDFFCTNGMVRGEHDKVRRKNTSGFNLERFIYQLSRSKQDFYAQSNQLQEWANKSLFVGDVKAMLESLDKGKAKRMLELYNQEAGVRGNNVFALYSAFTNYASYADERNGFKLANTGKDTNAVNMWEREQKVTRWVESKQFKELLAA